MIIPNRIFLRYTYPDGRTSTLVVWVDGEWKVEIFASEDHARQFAALNSMEVNDVRSSS